MQNAGKTIGLSPKDKLFTLVLNNHLYLCFPIVVGGGHFFNLGEILVHCSIEIVPTMYIFKKEKNAST